MDAGTFAFLALAAADLERRKKPGRGRPKKPRGYTLLTGKKLKGKAGRPKGSHEYDEEFLHALHEDIRQRKAASQQRGMKLSTRAALFQKAMEDHRDETRAEARRLSSKEAKAWQVLLYARKA